VQVATSPTASEFRGGIIGVTLRPVSGADLISPITALATVVSPALPAGKAKVTFIILCEAMEDSENS